MKKFLIILLTFASTVAVQADNLLVLEALIANHKSLSNKLRNRGLIEGSLTVATKNTTNETDDYKVIISDMQNRVEGAFSNVQFYADLAVLTNMAIKTADVCTNGIGRAIDKSIEHPILLPYASYALDIMGMHINGIYKLIAMVATGGAGVVLATNEDRTQFCFMIRTKLMEIQRIAQEMKMMTYRCEMFGGVSETQVNKMMEVMKGSLIQEAHDKALEVLKMAATKL